MKAPVVKIRDSMSEQKDSKLKCKVGATDIRGTSGQGDLYANYDELVKAFGEPTFLGDSSEKTQAEWHLTFEDGLVAAIYDYKEYDTEKEDVVNWRVGGRDSEVCARVNKIILDARTTI